MKRVVTVLLLLLALCAASCDRRPQGSTVVIVVRHAEKANDADDSPLTEAGAQRAQALAGIVAAGAGVKAIYTTQFRRNHDTARPLAERTGVAVNESPVNLQNPGDYGRRLARDIVEKHRGQTVVVVGHANTVASTVEGLTGVAADLGDIQYSDLLVVTVPPAGPPSLIRAQYGAGATRGGMLMHQ